MRGIAYNKDGKCGSQYVIGTPKRKRPPPGAAISERGSFLVLTALQPSVKPLTNATATTAASGGNREEPLGPRPAGCERQRSRRWEPQPGLGERSETERASPSPESRYAAISRFFGRAKLCPNFSIHAGNRAIRAGFIDFSP